MPVMIRRLLPLLVCFPLLTAAAPREPLMVDGDGDGVSDEIDDCPYTHPGIQVDAHGCPLQKDDGDADGVPDDVDDCPYTQPGAIVDVHGCAIDSDLDGVPDGVDRCPNTVLGMVVDAMGCSAGQTPQPAGPRPQPSLNLSTSPQGVAKPATAVPATATTETKAPAAAKTKPKRVSDAREDAKKKAPDVKPPQDQPQPQQGQTTRETSSIQNAAAHDDPPKPALVPPPAAASAPVSEKPAEVTGKSDEAPSSAASVPPVEPVKTKPKAKKASAAKATPVSPKEHTPVAAVIESLSRESDAVTAAESEAKTPLDSASKASGATSGVEAATPPPDVPTSAPVPAVMPPAASSTAIDLPPAPAPAPVASAGPGTVTETNAAAHPVEATVPSPPTPAVSYAPEAPQLVIPFAVGSSTLPALEAATTQAYARIFARELKANPKTCLRMEASVENNEPGAEHLLKTRAASMRRILVQEFGRRGVALERIELKSALVAPAENVSNRQVRVVIVETCAPPEPESGATP